MLELLSTLTFTQILFYAFLILFGIKEALELKDFFKKRSKKGYDKEAERERKMDSIVERMEKVEGRLDGITGRIEGVTEHFNQKFEQQEHTLEILTDSDRDDIRGWIVEKYHYYTEKGWIDDFSMDCVEKRYVHYKDEGGNSYISGLVSDLRKLPKQPPQ